MRAVDRITIAGRVFCIAIIFGLGLLSRDLEVLLSLAVIAAAATTAIYLTLTTPVATALVVTIEAAVTGLIIAVALPGSIVFLPYLVVLTLLGGIAQGVVGVSAVVLTEVATVTLITVALRDGADPSGVFRILSPWLITSIGAGMLGAWLTHLGVISHPDRDDEAAYGSAHRLLTQLRTVARRLSSGLDPQTMAVQALEAARHHLAFDMGAVFVRTDGGLLAPLAYTSPEAVTELFPQLPADSDWWVEMEPNLGVATSSSSRQAHFPLRAGARMIGVLATRLCTSPTSSETDALMRELDEHSIRLDTALTFDEVRSIATVEERRRLAREIHDGIAQEVASIGYLVDDLLLTANSDEQHSAISCLRHELTRVVNELRLSIFDLRSEVLTETGLGAALSEYVRQVGSRSDLTVHLSLNEAPMRLRAESEMQLLRIAQEAITNARKHSGARNLWVRCEVSPPYARLEVRDDGVGLREGRLDSYGLRIMRERAQRLAGSLTIEPASANPVNPGTIVSVTVGECRDDRSR